MRVKEIKKMFENWEAAKYLGLHLDDLEQGKCEVALEIKKGVMTPHEDSVLLGGIILTAASMAGVMALMTLLKKEEDGLITNVLEAKWFQPAILEERYVLIRTAILQPPDKNNAIIIARAVNQNEELKAKFLFRYTVVTKERRHKHIEELRQRGEYYAKHSR
ncbi:hypothetical protein A2926_00815 [Candidatus Giovannonibacteria bacterium RIFCSPLOWO2_01_FULL_44_40]|uniref:Thioesterase domain-containing protein n=1 Tax=Candidatus Giovannonibacteria bacterium RIFCSPHIGHO2_01_FULL_45_23 TaxID=1798325 RepID=A0A1F5VKH7_9BACT|nr:MAG: hypothetical protein A2834_01215 [Candidatus Giovannonibacteria bacterium RIFCSPHIGHO2_01_FULL_45_23]OGF75634.1 MAG: hypothetical protein A3C77_03315 [Candidatus Giovannonibacteria bacterium RIFCSPHIGHO2_02_FULL_45_13]OGF80058.1 MAG: hypothetical protein A2926_00815 [Candidatus Giovannonibacteria bacterium RIFCSPLOWO2_01_FULL_44_40]